MRCSEHVILHWNLELIKETPEEEVRIYLVSVLTRHLARVIIGYLDSLPLIYYLDWQQKVQLLHRMYSQCMDTGLRVQQAASKAPGQRNNATRTRAKDIATQTIGRDFPSNQVGGPTSSAAVSAVRPLGRVDAAFAIWDCHRSSFNTGGRINRPANDCSLAILEAPLLRYQSFSNLTWSLGM